MLFTMTGAGRNGSILPNSDSFRRTFTQCRMLFCTPHSAGTLRWMLCLSRIRHGVSHDAGKQSMLRLAVLQELQNNHPALVIPLVESLASSQ